MRDSLWGLLAATSLLMRSMAYDITFTYNQNVMCDNSVWLFQSDDRGATWTTVYNAENSPDLWYPPTTTITVTPRTKLRFGCYNYGNSAGYLYGTGITVDGVNYPFSPNGDYELVGYQKLSADQSTVPDVSDVNALANPQSVIDSGGLATVTTHVSSGHINPIWVANDIYTSAGTANGVMWVDFDFLNTGIASYDISFVSTDAFACDDRMYLYQSDDRGSTWAPIWQGTAWFPATTDLTVTHSTILRFGCLNGGGPGYIYGSGVDVNGENYPLVPGGNFVLVGWTEYVGTQLDNDNWIPDVSALENPASIAGVGDLVKTSYVATDNLWTSAKIGVAGTIWLDFDFLNTVLADGFFFCSVPADRIDWDTLATKGINIPDISWDIQKDDQDLSLNVHVELEYLGYSTADGGAGDFGTTYVLDFEDFDAHKDDIYAPGTCQNRRKEDFYNGGQLRDFSEWWQYSETPGAPGNLGSVSYLAYPPPPSDKWSVSVSDDCSTVIYDGHFTWNELVSCNNGEANADSYVDLNNDADPSGDITLNGVFYVNVVSPLDYQSDLNYYRVYQLLSQPFTITISKSIYVIGSAGINVLAISVIAVYKEDGVNIASDNSQNDFKLVVLTEAQEYLKLEISGDANSYTFAPSGSATITTGEFTLPSIDETGGDCLGNKAYICSQLWEIAAYDVDCKVKGIDFSGLYTLRFNPVCRADVGGNVAYNGYCQTWLTDHPAIAGGVDLVAELTWRDDVCEPKLYEVHFSAELNFFTDSSYASSASGADPHLFAVGEDTIYVEIDTGFADGTYDVFDTVLRNVWICTFDPLYYNQIAPPDADTATGGCFDPNRDPKELPEAQNDENPYFYHIFSSDGTTDQDFALATADGHPDAAAESRDQLRFSFKTPAKIRRDRLYVHAQVEVTLVDGTRRRVLLRRKGRGTLGMANQMSHFIEDIGLRPSKKEPEERPYQPQPEQPAQPNQPISAPHDGTWTIDLNSPWIIAIGGVLAVILACNVVFMCYLNCCNKQQRARVSFNRRRRSGYASVKNVDSEDFNESEANAINVVSD